MHSDNITDKRFTSYLLAIQILTLSVQAGFVLYLLFGALPLFVTGAGQSPKQNYITNLWILLTYSSHSVKTGISGAIIISIVIAILLVIKHHRSGSQRLIFILSTISYITTFLILFILFSVQYQFINSW